MIELTSVQLLGIVVIALLLGGSLATWGGQFLAWTDRRRAER